MYAAYSEWIDYEIDTAIDYGKPIIGVKPRGQERIPVKIRNNAEKLLKYVLKSDIILCNYGLMWIFVSAFTVITKNQPQRLL